MAAKKITLVETDDSEWTGIYVDGVLQDQNHSFNEKQVLDLIGVKYTYIELTGDQMDELGNELPEKESELPRTKHGT